MAIGCTNANYANHYYYDITLSNKSISLANEDGSATIKIKVCY